ncbi:hypothetical protein U9M48_034747 [Paspalum notatum var. saurae]|uniref:Aminotransferase-like plant mobile domain-containing protein n=1 Tax=Paspalum notatum var. saurae TaxID=547442 RepID=A0AAQ3UE35_PASNO
MAAPQGYVTPELLDAAMDRKHRSYFSDVLGCSLGQFRARIPMETMVLDPRWLPRLRASGLLPLARLVEGERPRFSYDFSLLAALVDRWRPVTHTLHLTVGEMAPTLQDVSYLLGLLLRGDAMGPTDVGQGWRDDLLDRFGRVQHSSTAQAYREFAPTHTGGPPKWWILQFKVDDIRVGATEYEVARHLEAYVLWLMGWVMFRSADAEVPTPFARYVADGPPEAIPRFQDGAATYRGLCTSCLKSSGAELIFGGCPLLLQLWAHERFQIGRPAVVHSPYEAYIVDDVDGPTMGSLWCDRRFAYAHVQTRKSYPDFVGQFDVLRDDEVLWEPYSGRGGAPRTRGPITSVRTRRRVPEDTQPTSVRHLRRGTREHRVLSSPRFVSGDCRASEPSTATHAPDQSVGQLWAPRLAEFMAKWTTALDHVVLEARPHDDAAWYLPRTRVHVLSTPRELPRRTPSVTDSYPTHPGASLAVSFFTDCRLLIETHRSLYFLAN